MHLTPAEATVIAATVALVVGGGGLWEKYRADRKDAWWKRAQWAIDKSLSDDDPSRQIGLGVMAMLARNTRAAGDDDIRLLRVATTRALDNVFETDDDEGHDEW